MGFLFIFLFNFFLQVFDMFLALLFFFANSLAHEKWTRFTLLKRKHVFFFLLREWKVPGRGSQPSINVKVRQPLVPLYKSTFPFFFFSILEIYFIESQIIFIS